MMIKKVSHDLFCFDESEETFTMSDAVSMLASVEEAINLINSIGNFAETGYCLPHLATIRAALSYVVNNETSAVPE